MKNLVIDTVQFTLITHRLANRTVGLYVRKLVESALQDGAPAECLSFERRELYEAAFEDEANGITDDGVKAETKLSYLQKREEWEKI